jgi:hypothetical protein
MQDQIKSASGVLATLRGSTYRPAYALASSLAAALLDGLSEQAATEGLDYFLVSWKAYRSFRRNPKTSDPPSFIIPLR